MSGPELRPFQSLFSHIKKYAPLSDSDQTFLSEHLNVQSLKSKEVLVQAGQVCRARYFVAAGCLRMFIHTKDGTDQIIQFAIDNWWMSDYTSLDSEKPSVYTIQSVEPTTVVALSKNIQEEVFQKVPSLERYLRIVYQRAYSASLMRFHFTVNLSGEERFHNFNNAFPEFVQRVPQYMLASFLGFTPEFLSKIRAKKN